MYPSTVRIDILISAIVSAICLRCAIVCLEFDLQNDLRCLCKYFLNQSPDAFDFVPAISRLQPYQPRALSSKFVEQRSGRHLHLLVDGKPDPLIQNQLSIRRAG